VRGDRVVAGGNLEVEAPAAFDLAPGELGLVRVSVVARTPEENHLLLALTAPREELFAITVRGSN